MDTIIAARLTDPPAVPDLRHRGPSTLEAPGGAFSHSSISVHRDGASHEPRFPFIMGDWSPI